MSAFDPKRTFNGPSITQSADRTGAPSRRRLSFWELVRKNSELMNLWRLGKQVAGFCLFHQGSRHFAVKVCVPSGLVVKRIEDGERRRSFLNGKP